MFNKEKDASMGHATEKSGADTKNVQAEAVQKGIASKKAADADGTSKDGSGAGIDQSDPKKWGTRAPGPVIGMQDERGGIEK